MSEIRVVIGSVKLLEEVFDEVAAAWGLSAAERDAVRGTSMPVRGRARRSRFEADRMALVVEIDWLLGTRMDPRDVRAWLRRRVAGVFGSSPIEDMFGSTDRLRRIRTLLQIETSR